MAFSGSATAISLLRWEPQVMVTELTKTKRSIIRLLGLDPRTYGLPWPVARPAGKCCGDLRKVSPTPLCDPQLDAIFIIPVVA